jgi:hypothetical protein
MSLAAILHVEALMRLMTRLVLCAMIGLTGSHALGGDASETHKASAAGTPEVQDHDLIAKGLAYLKDHQRPEGTWHTPQEPPGISAIVLKASGVKYVTCRRDTSA